MARTIQSPGVEIREIDQSLITNTSTGTNIFVAGYAPQGPTDEIIQVTSVDDLQKIYGVPSNAAERYFYYSAKTILDRSNATLNVARLPYDYGIGDTTQYYNALQYGVGIDLQNETIELNVIPSDSISSSELTIYNPLYTPTQLGVGVGSIVRVMYSATADRTRAAKVISINDGSYSFVIDQLTGLTSIGDLDFIPIGVSKPYAKLSLSADYSTALSGFVITKPIHEKVSKATYDEYKNGTHTWRTKPYSSSNLKDSIVIFNKNKDIVEPNFSGYYVSIADNSVVSPASTELFDAAESILVNGSTYPTISYGLSGGTAYLSGATVSNWTELNQVSFDSDVSTGAYDFELTSAVSAASNTDSVSEVISNIPTFNIGTNEFKDTIIVSVFKLRPSLFGQDPNKLDYVLMESFVGSLDSTRKINNVNGGAPVNFFIEDVVNNGSTTIEMYVNPYLSGKSEDITKNVVWSNGLSGSNEPNRYVRVLSEKSLNDLTETSKTFIEGDDVYGTVAFSTGSWSVGDTSFVAGGSFVSDIFVGMKLFNNTAFASGTRVTNVNGSIVTFSPAALEDSEPSTTVLFYYESLPASSQFTNYSQIVKLYNNSLYNIGNYQSKVVQSKYIGSVPTKLERILRKLENKDVYQVDVVADAGLSTIFAGQKFGVASSLSAVFDDIYYSTAALDDNLYDESGDTGGNEIIANWKTVTDTFINFAEKNRKDVFFISDALRYIFVQGNTPTLKNEDKTFSQHITRALKNIYGPINTSYAATYANWGKTYDGVKDKYFWLPMSGHIAALLGRIDQNQFPWSAPMGLNRAILSGIVELAISPNQKERDQLYRININPIVNFPNDGLTVFGQKTLQKKPSAFDRINVRRLFLWLEKRTEEVAKYYIGEPNTVYTRTRFKNTLTPIFDLAKNNEGVYEYLIKCDATNNPPDLIDQNELHALIYIKPVRTAEFIVIDFVATKTGATFGENG